MADDGFALEKTFVPLGLGSVAVALPDFQWDEDYLEEYSNRFLSDGDEGRLVCVTPQEETWTYWERHPAGDELVVLLSGRVGVIQDLPDGPHVVELRPGRAMINPRGVWHTSDVHEPGGALFVTPGAATEHRPRAMNAIGSDLPGPGVDDVALASLAMARRFAAGGTLWCAAPASPAKANEMAGEFARPVTAGGRSLRTAPVRDGDLAEMLRALVRAGDMLLLATASDDASVAGLRERAAAWGVLTVWAGTGMRPEPGAADYVLWDGDASVVLTTRTTSRLSARGSRAWSTTASGTPRSFRLSRPTVTRRSASPARTRGDLGEVVAVGSFFQAEVRTPSGTETVDTSLVEDARAGDVVLIHAALRAPGGFA